MSATVAHRVSLSKRLLLAAFLAVAVSVVLVPGASAGNFDEQKMGCVGENPATCPTGTVGQPYAMTIYLTPPDSGRGEDFGCANFNFAGNYPPGLAVSDEGYITGTPTQAGNFDFYLEVKYNKPGCFKTPSDDRFVIPINPAVPKLTIGPQSAPSGTVEHAVLASDDREPPRAEDVVDRLGSAAGRSDARREQRRSSPGLRRRPGSSNFTVQAVIDAQRTDTKALGIVVRDPLAITAGDLFDESSTAPTEVGVLFAERLTPAGGLGPYTMAQTGTLPSGITFDAATGSLTGRATIPGRYGFTVNAADSEGRTATYSGIITVANRLAITTKRLKPGKVGKLYRAKLVSTGGVAPVSWRIKRGPLPRGIRFDKTTGTFVGIPQRAGTWIISVEVMDELARQGHRRRGDRRRARAAQEEALGSRLHSRQANVSFAT